MQASIIIPTLNRSVYLERTLNGLLESDFNPREFEIIVIDNGSTDNTKIIVEKFIQDYQAYRIIYIYDDQPGMLTGRHRGAQVAKGQILTFIDDDIKAVKGWLTAIIEAFSDPDVHLVGGRNLPEYEKTPPKWLQWFWHNHPSGKFCGSLSLLDFGENLIEIDPVYIWGLNFSIRKKTLYELGGFHPDCIPRSLQHFQGDGETGLTMKAKEKGYKAVYQPMALVYHLVPGERMTYEYFDKRFFYQGVCNSYSYIRKSGKLNEDFLSNALNAGHNKMEKSKSKWYLLKNLFFSDKKRLLQHRFFRKEQEGYLFHQLAVKSNPKLLEWVLKDNYFDYRLPEISLAFCANTTNPTP